MNNDGLDNDCDGSVDEEQCDGSGQFHTPTQDVHVNKVCGHFESFSASARLVRSVVCLLKQNCLAQKISSHQCVLGYRQRIHIFTQGQMHSTVFNCKMQMVLLENENGMLLSFAGDNCKSTVLCEGNNKRCFVRVIFCSVPL